MDSNVASLTRLPVSVALTIAGSDPSGGAGIQADLKTFHQHGVYGMSAITLLTVQNTTAVSAVHPCEPDLVHAQIRACVEDIPPHAIKTGALGTAAVVRAVARALVGVEAPLVVDPVMISKHGHALVDDDAIEAAIAELFPRATLITPNLPEAERLLGAKIEGVDGAEQAARELVARLGSAVLLKGGHASEGDALDVLVTVDGLTTRYRAPRIETPHTHGTGCTFSAAITALLARGSSLSESIGNAKEWLSRAIASGPDVGRGIGPVGHFARIGTPLETPRRR